MPRRDSGIGENLPDNLLRVVIRPVIAIGTCQVARKRIDADNCMICRRPRKGRLDCQAEKIKAGDNAKRKIAVVTEYPMALDELAQAYNQEYRGKAEARHKVAMDNFLECYHCAPAHRDFVDLVDMSSYRTVTHGIHASLIAGAPKSFDNNAYSFERGAVDFGYAAWYLWPNLTIWIYPGEPNLSVLQMNPSAPGTTTEYQDWFLPSVTPSRQLRDAMAYQKDVLQPEDISLCESVQRGLKSKAYNQGRIMVDRDRSELSEHAVHHFQSLVVNAISQDVCGLEPKT